MDTYQMPDWHCKHCKAFSILGGNVSRDCVIVNRQRIEAHMKTHRGHLEEHGGDIQAMELRLQNPAAYHASITVPKPEAKPEPEPEVKSEFPAGLDYDPDDISDFV